MRAQIRFGNIISYGKRQPSCVLALAEAIVHQRLTTQRTDRRLARYKKTKHKNTKNSNKSIERIGVENVPAIRLKSTPHSWPMESSILRRGIPRLVCRNLPARSWLLKWEREVTASRTASPQHPNSTPPRLSLQVHSGARRRLSHDQSAIKKASAPSTAGNQESRNDRAKPTRRSTSISRTLVFFFFFFLRLHSHTPFCDCATYWTTVKLQLPQRPTQILLRLNKVQLHFG